MANLKFFRSICAIFLYLFSAIGSLYAAEPTVNPQGPLTVIEAYLRATYARDFAAAYRFLSAEDRKVRDLKAYLRQRGPFSGFTLEVARKLSESLQITPVQQQVTAHRAQAVIRYRLPDPKKLAPLVFNWNAYQLNSLPAQNRRELLENLDKQIRDGLLDMSEGTETFELVKEGNDWRILLNWAAGVRIPLRLDLSKVTDLDVNLSKSEVVLRPGELFEINLSIKNRAEHAVTARIGHLVEPGEIADYLDFVECGFLLPVTIEPNKEQKFFGTYMLRGSLPEGVRQLNLTYDFRLLK
ncbi:MAG: hypothetical protein ACREQ2_27480 [Candidatus Binatia bacterium]